MWKCPVCDKEDNAATVCPTCGYDRTCDYEQYPTAFAVKRATPTRTLRRQWQEKQNPPVNGRNRKRTVTVTQEQAAQGCRITAGYVDGQRLEITVPAGTKDGSVLRCRGLGQPGSNGGRNGDLLVTVRVQEPPEPDGLYDAPKDPPVKGGDLRETVYITPDQATRGCQLRVTPSGGSTCQVTIPGTCTDGKTMRYTSLGQPGRNGGKNGDLILTVRVQQPEPAQQAKQAQQQAQQPKQAQDQKTYISATATITPQEAAAGVITTTVRDNNKFPLSLSIPAGVVWGEKLHYSQVRGVGGSVHDVTITVKIYNRPIHWLLRIIITFIVCIAIGIHDGNTWEFITIFRGDWIDWLTGVTVLGFALLIATVIEVFLSDIISIDKKKYGPKTPEEKRRCETPREMPPQR